LGRPILVQGIAEYRDVNHYMASAEETAAPRIRCGSGQIIEEKKEMIRVFIIDDHAIVREGVRRIISATGDIEVVGEAANGENALAELKATECDVVLLDLSLPGMDGLEVLRGIQVGMQSSIQVLILSIYPEEDYAYKAYKEGAAGYLTKESLPAELIDAIRRVAKGKKYLSDSFGERLMGELTGTGKKLPHETLSERENEVFHLILAGKSLKEMAAALSVAPTTVASYRIRILKKMGADNNTDLIRYGFEHHLID
jgi:two-component system, NarL family, invasion response regulator UvrY